MIIPGAMNNQIQAKRVSPGQESNPTSLHFPCRRSNH